MRIEDPDDRSAEISRQWRRKVEGPDRSAAQIIDASDRNAADAEDTIIVTISRGESGRSGH
jgi:hypothetical protein